MKKLDLNKVNFKEYKAACIEFRKDTKEWSMLDTNNLCVSNGDEWAETCDNDIGGLDVSWCFKIKEEEFLERVYEEYIKNIKNNINAIVTNDCITEWNKNELEQYFDWLLGALS